MQQERSSPSAAIALVRYCAPHSATARRPGIEMMSVVLLQPVAISIERSTNRPCALDICNTARSFTHESNTCVITRLAFLNLGLINLLSCTPLPATFYHLASENSGLSTNLKILRLLWEKLGISKKLCWRSAGVILVAPRRIGKIN